jgi:predicted RNase H-like nuclease (RuvC/YqgF family)
MFSAIIIIVLLVCLGIAVLRVSYVEGKLQSTRSTSSRLIHQQVLEINDLKAACTALRNSNEGWEKGIEDQQEIYEQQFLSLNEILVEKNITIEKLREDLRVAQAINMIHGSFCLPIMNESQVVEKYLAKTAPDHDVEALLNE